MKTIPFALAAAAAVALLVAGCASRPAPDLDATAQQVIKSSFRDQGIATIVAGSG